MLNYTARDRRLLQAASILALALLLTSGTARLAPVHAQSSYSITQTWVDQMLAQWQPASASAVYPMEFGATALRASYGNVYNSYNTPAVVNASLATIEQTGVGMVRIDMGFDAFLSNDTTTISQLDSYVHAINASGSKLVLADASAERYRSYPLSWNDFKNQWYTRAYVLAQRYHPYAYVVVKEPGWYYPMISDSSYNPQVYNASDWTQMTANLIKAVKLASPQTKVGVAVAAIDLYHDPGYQGRTSFNVQYLQDVEKLSGLDFIGFDIYDIPGFNDTQQFLSQVGSGGKNVWIAEAWSADGSVVTDSSRSALDASWIRALYYFGLKEHAQAILPFYTDLFASYGTPPQDPAGLLKFFQGRTPVFDAYQQIIASNKAGQLPGGSNATSTTSSNTSTSTSTTSSSGSTSTSTGGSSTTSSTSSSSQSSTPTSTGTAGGRQAASGSLGAAAVIFLLVLFVAAVVLLRRRGRGHHASPA